MATYAHVIKVLAALFRAGEEAMRGPLRGRLQNFQRLGIPLGLQIGKGKKIDYQSEQIYQLAFCLELADAGVIPSQIARIVRVLWGYKIYGYFKEELANPSVTDDLILIFELSQMALGREDLNEDFYFAAIRGSETLSKSIKGFIHEGWRHLSLINVSALVRAVEKHRALIPSEGPAR